MLSDYLPLAALVVFMLASVWLGILANRTMEGKSFLKSYFLGNRGLGPWAMALTATVQSGGTFMGFPSLVYTYGWVVALWIASYMMVPLCTFGILGKRIGKLSRLTGAITLPDLFQERFRNPALGRAASFIIIVFLTINMVAQFKGGAIILKSVMAGSSRIPLSETSGGGSVDTLYLVGLVIFTIVVTGYTLYGGFLAAVWTDVFQSIMMLVGVLLLFPLVLSHAGGLEQGTRASIAATGPGFAFGPGYNTAFLPLGLAVSFFCMWSLGGMGQPSTIVRHMAFNDTRTLRHATFLLSIYNMLIYIPLVMIFICARSIMPELAAAHRSDEVMPLMAIRVAHPIVAGLILTAPFGAVMATVSAFLVVISSGLARDVFQRWYWPDASERMIQVVTYIAMVVIAFLVGCMAIKPPEFLQALIVYTGGSLAAAFLFPAVMTAFWPRATAAGTLASMIAGPTAIFLLYVVNWLGPAGTFKGYLLGGLDPLVWGMLASVVFGLAVSICTAPPDQKWMDKLFEK